ncbi:MAG TPA: DUF4410 domain-containing protein [Candidatus Acidoferrales bacterium]|nr:DUF4410 domain-containing protein [Candidatus Acidoferrales bacterium]
MAKTLTGVALALALTLTLALVPAGTAAQESTKPTILVHAFTLASGVVWPYDMKQMQVQSAAELKAKDPSRFDVVTEPPAEASKGHLYTLDGEVTSWHPGNRAKRMIVGMGSGRESAEIHYWLTDEKGVKVFEHKDTIRAEFYGNAYAGSVGELAHPFGDKIAGRLKDSKVQ